MRTSLKIFLTGKSGKLLLGMIQVGLGLLFVYASLDKIWNPGLFAKSISNYRILPLSMLHISAIILPWIEFSCGMALILNRYHRAANIIIAALLGVFILAIISAIARGLDFNCGCFGVDSEESNMGMLKLLQNMGLLLSCVLIEFRTRVKFNLNLDKVSLN